MQVLEMDRFARPKFFLVLWRHVPTYSPLFGRNLDLFFTDSTFDEQNALRRHPDRGTCT